MKYIEIILNNKERIEIKDDDNTEISSYSKLLSSVLKQDNISILQTEDKTSNRCLIVRPSQIFTIDIKENKLNSNRKPRKKKNENYKVTEDIKSKKIQPDILHKNIVNEEIKEEDNNILLSEHDMEDNIAGETKEIKKEDNND